MRCRPGDLAVIVTPEVAENRGKLVDVLWRDDSPRGPAWRVRSLGAPMRSMSGRVSMEGRALDSALRPIRPDADPVETETEREVTA